MNDTISTATAPSVSVGQLLIDARTAAGLTVLEVANKLNLTVSVIECLEQERFSQLPGTTFARGYIRSYAKLLHLDANQLVQLFDQQVGVTTDVAAVHSIDRVGESRRVSRGMLQFGLFLLLLMVIAAVYYGWQSRQVSEALVSQKAPVFERVEVERADGSMHVQNLDELEDQAVALALENQAPDLVVEPLTTAGDSTLIDAETTLAQPLDPALQELSEQPATVLEPETFAPGIGQAQISFTSDCWVKIIDADGKQMASGLQRAGERLVVSGKAPLDVHLGYAKGVNIIYNGKAVDFSAAVSGETARIKLGQ